MHNISFIKEKKNCRCRKRLRGTTNSEFANLQISVYGSRTVSKPFHYYSKKNFIEPRLLNSEKYVSRENSVATFSAQSGKGDKSIECTLGFANWSKQACEGDWLIWTRILKFVQTIKIFKQTLFRYQIELQTLKNIPFDSSNFLYT